MIKLTWNDLKKSTELKDKNEQILAHANTRSKFIVKNLVKRIRDI